MVYHPRPLPLAQTIAFLPIDPHPIFRLTSPMLVGLGIIALPSAWDSQCLVVCRQGEL